MIALGLVLIISPAFILVSHSIDTVTYRERRSAAPARRATEAYSFSPLRERNVAGVDAAALECQRIYGTRYLAPEAVADQAGDKVVVVVVDRVSIDEFPSSSTPFCLELARRGAVGLMMTRMGKESAGAGYVTLGAGARSVGAGTSGLSFNSTEPLLDVSGLESAGVFHAAAYGEVAPKGSVVCLGFPEIQRSNEGSSIGAKPGLLGEELREAGIRSAVVGNADTYRRLRRFAPLIVCDYDGTVLAGDVGKDNYVADPTFPGGYRSDLPANSANFLELLNESDVMVVDLGDTLRVESEAGYLSPESYRVSKREALANIDSEIRFISSHLDLDKSLLIVLSPDSSLASRGEGDYLTPVIAVGGGIGRGLLSSPSTRRPGMIDNTDFAPTILDHFGLEVPESMVGRPFSVKKHGGPLSYLKSLTAGLGVTRKVRWPLVIGLMAIGIMGLLAGPFFLLYQRRTESRSRWNDFRKRILPPLATVLLCAPLTFLLTSLFNYDNYYFPVLFSLIFPVFLGLALWWLLRRFGLLYPLVAVCFLTVLALVVDLFTGWHLLMRPLLGANALEGARYYGISNAYVGILLGCAVMGVAGLVWELNNRGSKPGVQIDRKVRGVVLGIFILLAFIVGLGVLGANIGGFITVLATGVILYWALSGRGMNLSRTAITIASVLAGLVIVLGLDLLFFEGHAARAGGRVAKSGPQVVFDVFRSKLSISFWQIRYFLVPAILFLVAMLVVLLWIRRDTPGVQRAWVEITPLMAGFYTVLVGGLVGLVFNDTGVVLCGLFAMVGAIFLIALSTGPDLERLARYRVRQVSTGK